MCVCVCVCVLNLTFWLDAKSGLGLYGHQQKKRNRTAKEAAVRGRGNNICGRGQYLLEDYVRGGQFPLAGYVRGEKICGGTESAPTTACKADV